MNDSDRLHVTVLGTGVMGAGMARSLRRAGHAVTVWNRTAEKAAPLADDGVTVASDATDAVRDAEVVVTMLFDAAAVRDVMEKALPALEPDAVWMQSSTVGRAGVADLAALAEEHRVAFLDAPVLGTRKPAEEGALVVVASGDADIRDRVEPVFDAIGSRTVWAGDEIGRASALKLVVNSWVATLTAGVAQSLALADAFDVDPRLFLESIGGGPTDTPYAHVKGALMLDDDFPVAFALDGVLKDLGLIVDAGREAGLDPAVAGCVREVFARASQAGLGDQDMAAVHRVLRRD